jgi:hypothetical protein
MRNIILIILAIFFIVIIIPKLTTFNKNIEGAETSTYAYGQGKVYSTIQSYLRLRNMKNNTTIDNNIIKMIKNLNPYGGNKEFMENVNTILAKSDNNTIFKDLEKTFNTSFSPLIIDGCTNWYDASDPNGNGILPSNQGEIRTWVDKSSQKNNMIAQEQNRIGKYDDTNGLGTIIFDNSWYRTKTPNATYPLDVYVVVKLNSTSKNERFAGWTISVSYKSNTAILALSVSPFCLHRKGVRFGASSLSLDGCFIAFFV